MKQTKRPLSSLSSWVLPLVMLALIQGNRATAQITNVLFFEDFSSNTIDTNKFAVDAPFFEGGKGDIAPRVENEVLEFTGTVSQQWWAGATLRLLQPFAASPETNIVVSVDRVAETGVGTASRSALWIMDDTRTKYVLYAEVVAEGGWHYNRKAGLTGDVPTGSGTDIAAFNGIDPVSGINYDDQGFHQMAAVINGKEIKLYLDGKYGTTVAFPFSTVVLELGSYARANGDTAGTTFDNLKVEAVGTATFSISTLSMGTGQTASNLVVRIPPSANADKAIVMEILDSRPTVALPVGATGGKLALTFAKGGPNTKTFDLTALAVGSAKLTLTNTAGILAGNALDVTVSKGPVVLLEDDFSGATLDTTKWRISNQSFEDGTGTFEVTQTDGALQISGWVDTQYWPGASLQTVGDFTASTNLPLVFEADRILLDWTSLSGIDSTAARSGAFITSYDFDTNRTSPWVFFGQNLGETGWEVNANPGNPTGSGTTLPAFAEWANDTNKHRIKLLADGAKVKVFLDGIPGGQFEMKLGAFLKFELAAFTRIYDDAVRAVFDNVKIANVLPCITAAPSDLLAILGDLGNSITVTIPKLLNVSGEVKVTATSRDPTIAEPEGAVGGSLTLSFPTGTSTKSLRVIAKASGNTTFDFTNDAGACVDNSVNVSVTPPPVAMLSDGFAAAELDTSKWRVDTTPLVVGGTLTADAAVVMTNGMVQLAVQSELVADWPGFTIWTASNYAASARSPIVFEIDRVKMEYVLVGGDASKQRSGIWAKSGTNYVFFSDLGSYNAVGPGWQYHRGISKTGDVLLGNPNATGTYIPEFNLAKYTDQKNHRMRMVVNGTSAKLYLDGVLGAEVAFPFSTGIVFGFGAYANYINSQGNVVDAFWDNAVVQGFPAQPKLTVSRQGANVLITWTGSGTLQSTDSLNPIKWTDVTPAPTGNSYSVTPAPQIQRFFRLRQ